MNTLVVIGLFAVLLYVVVRLAWGYHKEQVATEIWSLAIDDLRCLARGESAKSLGIWRVKWEGSNEPGHYCDRLYSLSARLEDGRQLCLKACYPAGEINRPHLLEVTLGEERLVWSAPDGEVLRGEGWLIFGTYMEGLMLDTLHALARKQGFHGLKPMTY